MSGEGGGEREDRTDDDDILGIPGYESEDDENRFIQNLMRQFSNYPQEDKTRIPQKKHSKVKNKNRTPLKVIHETSHPPSALSIRVSR
jgi:hypothetical protein